MKPSPTANPSSATAVAAAAKTAPAKPVDARVLNAKPQIGRYLAFAAQLGGLLLAMNLYHTMEKPEYLRLCSIVFGAFLVHYWLPLRFKEWFWVAVSIGGAFYFLEPRVAELLLAAGLLFFAIFRAPLAQRVRYCLIVLIFLGLMGCYALQVPHIPTHFYPIFGAIFMFRIVAYAYDHSHRKEPARLLPFLSYFFILPNYLFTLFPVIDYQTMRRTWYHRDIHDVAQRGIFWMTRGVIQLILYRAVVYFNDYFMLDRISSFPSLAARMVLTFLLYLNVSGQFHLIIGMLHLFGYDLPETNRRYLLSDSVLDFWRRINIYWKDFMVKVAYYPVYFRFRKRGDLRAQLIATASVILVTWIAHAYQYFWLRGHFNFTWPDTLFWMILGLFMMGNLVFNSRWDKKRPRAGWQGRALHATRVLATFTLIVTLWSLWTSSSIESWLDELAWWRRAGP
jgi:hypothetical protein